MTENNQKIEQNASSKWSLAGAVGAAFAASACCIGPLLVLFLGTGGALASGFSSLAKFRPLFVVITILSLGWAYYKLVYKPKKVSCEPGSQCENPATRKGHKILFWSIAVLSVILLAFPYILPMKNTSGAAVETHQKTETVVLNVHGMTCSSCATGVEYALKDMPGVVDARVSLKASRAVVKIDPSKVQPAQLVDQTRKMGYPAELKE